MTLLFTIVLSVLTLVIPRKYILVPYVVGACWVPADQTVMVGELNFQVLRILVLVGVLARGILAWDRLRQAWFRRSRSYPRAQVEPLVCGTLSEGKTMASEMGR